jgi:hypothetical protein
LLNTIFGSLSVGVAPSTNSYESIATVTVGSGGAASVTFSSIPSTYQHLQIRAYDTSNSLGWVSLIFNGDTTTNYKQHELRGDGSSASGQVSSTTDSMSLYLHNSNPSSGVIDILDYLSTNKNKTVRTLGGYDANGSGYISLTSNLWRATPAAITSILLTSTGSNFNQYSSFALYGIKGA